jgi:hypothetical protein
MGPPVPVSKLSGGNIASRGTYGRSRTDINACISNLLYPPSDSVVPRKVKDHVLNLGMPDRCIGRCPIENEPRRMTKAAVMVDPS